MSSQCPNCKSKDYEMGYGLAGGGFGPYKVCNECGEIYDKKDEASGDIIGFQPEKVVTITYTNHRGETSDRRIIIKGITWTETEWHPQEQYIVQAWDCDKDADRSFALKDICAWRFP